MIDHTVDVANAEELRPNTPATGLAVLHVSMRRVGDYEVSVPVFSLLPAIEWRAGNLYLANDTTIEVDLFTPTLDEFKNGFDRSYLVYVDSGKVAVDGDLIKLAAFKQKFHDRRQWLHTAWVEGYHHD